MAQIEQIDETEIDRRVGSGEAQYPAPPSLLDARYYRDPAQYEREVVEIFERSWFPICADGRLADPGDFTTWSGFGQSLVITRLADGDVAAWHNVCQHRGARLVEGSGRCAGGSFKCPWHGFSYDLEGKVIHVPMRETFDESELKELRAPQVRTAVAAGLIWANLAPDGPGLSEYLGGLGTELSGYGFDGWDPRYSSEWQIEANWKTVIDAFNETWHVPFTHKNTVRGGLLWKDAAIAFFEPHSMMAIPIRKKYADSPVANSDHRRTMLCHYLAFPNTIFNCFPDHAQVFSAWPLAPRRTKLTAIGFVAKPPQGADPDRWIARSDRDWEHFCSVVAEDEEVLRNAGEVYDSVGFNRNMFNSAEGRLTEFHRVVNERAGVGR